MKLNKIAATALLSVAATGIAAGTGYAQPAAVGPISGVDHGVSYAATLAPDHSSVTTTLAGGRFVVKPGVVDVLSRDGSVISEIPLALRAAGHQYRLAPQVDRAGTTLTVRSVDKVKPGATDIAALHNISLGGALVGVALGCIIGFLIGVWLFFIGGFFGCVIGAIIGGVVGSGD